MLGKRTILYWFRNPQWGSDNSYFGTFFNECSRFVPVYCFDPREEQFFNSPSDFNKYWNETVDKVRLLRSELQSKGSNLLIVNGSYEVLIPSLSRVLHAEEVVANAESFGANLFSSNLVEFRNQKALEIQHLMKMHSISMKLEIRTSNQSFELPASYFLPPFPEINPGMVPVRQLKNTC